MRSFLSPDNDGPLTSFLSADDMSKKPYDASDEASAKAFYLFVGLIVAYAAYKYWKK